MAERAADPELGRDTRAVLWHGAWSSKVCMLSGKGVTPVVPSSRVQQMLRSVDAEVRALAPQRVVQRFVRDLSAKADGQPNPATAESLFREAASPFLEKVWPARTLLSRRPASRGLSPICLPCAERPS